MNSMDRRHKYFADIFKATGNPEKVNFTLVRTDIEAIAKAEAEMIMEYASEHPYQPKKYKCSQETKDLVNQIRHRFGIKRSYKRKGYI